MTKQLTGKTGIIFGDLTEDYYELVIAAAKMGADVLVVYSNDDHETATLLQKQVEQIGQRCQLIHDPSQTCTFEGESLTEAVKNLGAIDFFISYKRAVKVYQDRLFSSDDSDTSLRDLVFPTFNEMKWSMEQLTAKLKSE